MDLQEEDAPELVNVGDVALSNQDGDLASLEPALEDLKVSKVPLTIVTGIDDPFIHLYGAEQSRLTRQQVIWGQERPPWSITF